MSMIYIITDPLRDGDCYKVGIHKGDVKKLIARYSTALPEVIVKRIFELPYEECQRIEKDLKNDFREHRVTNISGNLSEWIKHPYEPIVAYINKACTPEKMSVIGPPEEKVAAAPAPPFARVDSRVQVWDITRLRQLDDAFALKPASYQRPRDDDRCKALCEYILGNYSNPSFALGVITLNEVGGLFRIVDGQHRAAALCKVSSLPLSVAVDLRKGLSEAEERALFKAINSGIYCPKFMLVDDEVAAMYASIRTWLGQTYTDYLSGAPQPRQPQFNADTVLNVMTGMNTIRNMYEGEQIETIDDLQRGIEEVNAALGARFGAGTDAALLCYQKYQTGVRRKTDAPKFAALVAKARSKAKAGRSPCWLGMLPPDRWISFIKNLGIFA